jgi:hypothetical protein
MYEPDDVLDWETECSRAYHEAVKQHSTEGISRSKAIDNACRPILSLVADGSLVVPEQSICDAIKVALRKIDDRDLRLTDKVLRTLARGQASFEFDGDSILDMAVGLGDGLRKVYRYVTVRDLDRMNARRSENIDRVKRTYVDKWKSLYEAWRPILERRTTLGEAFDAGDLPSGLDDAA